MSSLSPEKLVHRHANDPNSCSLKANGGVVASPDLPIGEAQDEPAIRSRYRPFLLDHEGAAGDWVAELELDTVTAMAQADVEKTGSRLNILVLYGSLRKRSYSKLAAFEAARILHRLGCDVRIFNPSQLPIRDSVSTDHPAVQELRELSLWSDAHVWCSPEQHGNLTAVFKNQIDWIPLSTGSVRPTQGRTLAIVQVNGGSQSFNTVNSLRVLGRWMRMFTIPNQSSIPTAFKQFEDEGGDGSGKARLLPSGNRDRLVDCMEELVKYTIIMRQHHTLFEDRYSERKASAAKATAAFANSALK
ncbi:flavoprotein-like protein [Emericellopsis atlantica]|uniref:Flavoprotein-like protein n=1 Tax=Emericellopsis atlantica TaxID=2614577 RepID=A0A9P8CM40_9HYPO|nr:flavoprotein-like protein [Emericellopsis atlantica]KAG9251655.1 flavoprotein-like protein [Emericellopsis atlantica]